MGKSYMRVGVGCIMWEVCNEGGGELSGSISCSNPFLAVSPLTARHGDV